MPQPGSCGACRASRIVVSTNVVAPVPALAGAVASGANCPPLVGPFDEEPGLVVGVVGPEQSDLRPRLRTSPSGWSALPAETGTTTWTMFE